MTTEPQRVGIFFKDFKELTFERMNVLQRRVFLGISKMVIEATPVDEGRARGGWHGDVDAFTPGPDFVGSAGAATAAAMASVLGASSAHEDGQDLTLSNGVSYIRYLNAGSSKQAPAGMTDQAINAFSRFVQVGAREVNK